MAKEVENMSLNSPLIQISKENGLSYDRERSSEKISQRNEFFVEMKKQLWLVGPLINVNLLLYFLPLQVIFLMFVGHPGELALSGASMATSFASVSSFSILDQGSLKLYILGVEDLLNFAEIEVVLSLAGIKDLLSFVGIKDLLSFASWSQGSPRLCWDHGTTPFCQIYGRSQENLSILLTCAI
ncbi:protein detoxification 16 [Quercus suber]|uniref:Protein detoxification 16 n=1 Tax=Quercus suber TaxID=58331 RepID=A0AAW0KU90_QUESU